MQQKPIEGISFAYTFDDAATEGRRTTQYFEMGVNRGIYQDGWMASALSFPPSVRGPFDPDTQKWELYNINEDFSQANDLAAVNPEKLRQMQDLWWVEAAKYNVLPLDWRATERFDSELMGRPSLIAGRKNLVYYPGVVGLPLSNSPPLLNKSWTITAGIDLPDGGGDGMIVTEGGLEGGVGLYIRDGHPTFVYNYLSLERPTFAGKDPLPKGKSQIVVKFDYDGGGSGKGATVMLLVNGTEVAGGRVEKTVPVQFSLLEATRSPLALASQLGVGALLALRSCMKNAVTSSDVARSLNPRQLKLSTTGLRLCLEEKSRCRSGPYALARTALTLGRCYSEIVGPGTASKGSACATSVRALVPGRTSNRGSKSTMVAASFVRTLASPSTVAVPSAICASSVFAPIIVCSRSTRLMVSVRSGVADWKP